jgi:molybdenum storage protein
MRKLIEIDLFPNQSITSKRSMERTHRYSERGIMPGVKVVKIGGQSIIDRGRKAVYPLIDEIVKCSKKYPMIIGVGGGTRSRHVYSLAVELGLPAGVIAKLGTSISRQNARMLHMLLAPYGGVYIPKENLELVSLYIKSGCIPIVCGMPPYEYWEHPPREGNIPESRTDAGIFLIGEVMGAEEVIFVKDEDGLYTDDPKKNPSAKFIKEISVDELLKLDLPDMIIERKAVELLKNARHVKRIKIINGLKKGNFTKSLSGKNVGTIIRK